MTKPIAQIVMVKVADSVDIGAIDDVAAAAMKRDAGPIRLPEGIPGANGFGLLHLQSNASRMEQIKGLGFSNAIDFVVGIAVNWEEIREGNNGRLILIRPYKAYGLRGVVEWTQHNGTGCWSLTTAIPGRMRGPENVLFKREK